MTVSPSTLDRDDTQAVLGAMLRELHGPAARLERWTATPLTKRGRHRVVRYELRVRVANEPQVRHYQWVGKFYARPEEGERVATVLQDLQVRAAGRIRNATSVRL